MATALLVLPCPCQRSIGFALSLPAAAWRLLGKWGRLSRCDDIYHPLLALCAAARIPRGRRAEAASRYVGGMLELFYSSATREAVVLNRRKGFVKLALRSGADLIPTYMFGNTTVLTALMPPRDTTLLNSNTPRACA